MGRSFACCSRAVKNPTKSVVDGEVWVEGFAFRGNDSEVVPNHRSEGVVGRALRPWYSTFRELNDSCHWNDVRYSRTSLRMANSCWWLSGTRQCSRVLFYSDRREDSNRLLG